MANDFTFAGSCISAYNCEAGALGTDSKGANHLTVTGVTADAVNFKEGAASGDFELSEGDEMFRADADLSALFPLKYGTTNYSLTVTSWIRAESSSASKFYYFWSKQGSNTTYTTGGYIFGATPKVYFRLHNAGAATSINCNDNLVIGQWYFVACVFNRATGAITLYVWDETAAAWLTTASGTWDFDPTLSTADFVVGGPDTTGATRDRFDGNIDEVTVWNRALLFSEIDLIRQGLYASAWRADIFGHSSITATLNVASFSPWFGCPESPITEVLEWKTPILKAHDGTEQRIALRQGIPRQSFRYTFQLGSDAENARLDTILHKYLKRPWGVPIWSEYVEHTATLTAGDSSITLDTTNADFRNSSYALVWQENQAEVVKVSTKNDTTLTLGLPLANTYTGLKWIMPMREGYVMNVVPRKSHQTGVSLVELWLGVTDNVFVTGHSAGTTYDSLEVLTTQSFIDPTSEESFNGDVIILDGETGIWDHKSHTDFNEGKQSHLFHNDTKAACWNFRKFLHSLYGMQKTVLIPTFKRDMELTAQVASDATTFNVTSTGLAVMGVNTLRTYLAFVLTGSLVVRKITGLSTVDATTEQVTINTAPGVVIPAGTKVCFVDQCRLASDRLEIQWERPGKNSCKTQFQRVSG